MKSLADIQQMLEILQAQIEQVLSDLASIVTSLPDNPCKRPMTGRAFITFSGGVNTHLGWAPFTYDFAAQQKVVTGLMREALFSKAALTALRELVAGKAVKGFEPFHPQVATQVSPILRDFFPLAAQFQRFVGRV